MGRGATPPLLKDSVTDTAGRPPLPLPLVLTATVLAVSMGAVFVRMADAPGVVVALYRMSLAALLFLPFALRSRTATPAALGLSALSGVMLAGHFATWISSLSYTSVAASVALVSTNPLWLVLISWLILRAPVSRATLIGVLVAVAGGVLIGFDGTAGPAANGMAPLGNGLAVAGAIFVSAYLLLGQAAQRHGMSVIGQAGVAYLVAALTLLPLPLLIGEAYWPYSAVTLGWIALMALIPQLVGHTGINYAIRYMNPTVVSTIILLEPVGAGILALLIFGELPGWPTLAGAPLLLAGVMIVNWRSAKGSPA